MSLNIRLLALDIDGTLMDTRKRFPEVNIRALQECEARGIRVALVSGRSFEMMRRFARELGVHPIFAACNGARIEAGEDGPTLAEHCYPRASAERVCRTLEDSGMYFNAYRRGKCYMGNPEVKPTLGPRYAHHTPGISGDPGHPYEYVCDRNRLWGEGLDGVYKFVAMGEPYDPRFEGLKAELRDMNLSVSSASRRNAEFMPPGTDKGSAVRAICELLGIRREQVMAFGDQTNDIPMLEAAGWSFAMENAEEAVKRAAGRVAPHCDQGGVGLTLNELVLGHVPQKGESKEPQVPWQEFLRDRVP